MNLVDYGRILVRRGWIIILLAALAAGSAYVLSTQQQPVYRALQRVLIQPTRPDLSLTTSSRELLNSLRSYLDSSLIAALVIDQLQLDMTPVGLVSNVDVTVSQIDLAIEIAVDLPDGEMANRVAKAWGEQLVRYRNEQNQASRREDQVNALLQDNPSYSLLRPRPTINAAAGGVLGLLLGAVVIFVLEVLESRVIRRREDLEKALEIPVLAVFPDQG
jgi:capsular polysaccharide biosynthesis protein